MFRVERRRIDDALGRDPPRAVVVAAEEAARVALVTRGAALLDHPQQQRVAVAVDIGFDEPLGMAAIIGGRSPIKPLELFSRKQLSPL